MKFPIDHDLHCHTFVSGCSLDPEQNPAAMLAFAKAHGYTAMCTTDHLWDPDAPGVFTCYKRQTMELQKSILPLPHEDGIRFEFGCETEWRGIIDGHPTLGLAPEHYNEFAFIVVPPNHFHFRPHVRPDDCDTPPKVAELLVTRLEQLQTLQLPWEKVGIAHMNCGLIYAEGNPADVFDAIDEDRYRAALRFFAEKGAGIELNCSSFGTPKFKERPESHFRLFRMAMEEGCRLYLASDAHHPAELMDVPNRAPAIIEALGLESKHLYRLP